MSIPIKEGSTKRDWLKLAGAAAETALKSLTLGKDGFAAAVSPLFRVFESLRGNDSTERRATRLILETLSYAIAKTATSIQLGRVPLEPELQAVIEHLLARTQTLAEQREILFNSTHLESPATFVLFSDIASHIFHEFKQNDPKSREAEVVAIFQAAVTEGLSRVRTRSPEYYAPIFEVLLGPDARADMKTRAWEKYRELLVRRFEDEPLFGEDGISGVKLGQAYQSLRAFWDEDDDETAVQTAKKKTRHLRMLDDLVIEWLQKNDASDRVRLVSGGPGSGKSTFAKSLAAQLSTQPQWRVVFVPLQRLKGTGPLEGRIDEYFRLQIDEPFDLDTAPLLSLGRDGHRDWLIIFDGLDELAKEGASSESAAQDFATALADLRGRIGDASVRFLVLGRAPSMQEARRRLGLQGRGTVHVAGMAPISEMRTGSSEKIVLDDPLMLKEKDQRSEFWSRWAIAKKLPLTPPEAMSAEALQDLTNEPLLAYLLILSGYVGERWQEAAENRNRIYQAIFNQIWERERTKPTRLHLNDLGQDGFESLLQALGIAAWRGGGRTGDENTFISVRDIFMRPDLLASAKSCGAADLSSVALLFYTRKDDAGGRGYEFLHKSFGEYLTARGLFSAFQRWGAQVSDPTLDFDAMEFLRRWLRLTGPAPITREILSFLRNEVRLFSVNSNNQKPWEASRKLVRVAESLVDTAAREGLPAHESTVRWRIAEDQQRNGEISLFGLLDSLARAAYPWNLFLAEPTDGGWGPGPIRIPEFEGGYGFAGFLRRLENPGFAGWMTGPDYFVGFASTPYYSMLTRLSLQGAQVFGQCLSGVDFQGANFENAQLFGCTFVQSNFSGVNFSSARFKFTKFVRTEFEKANVAATDLENVHFDEESLKDLKLSASVRRKVTGKRKNSDRRSVFIVGGIESV